MIRILLLATGYTNYVCQLWRYMKRYYPEVKYSLLTMEQSARKYREDFALEDGEEIFVSSNKIVSLSMAIPIMKLPHLDIIQAMWMEIPWGNFPKMLKNKTNALYVEVGGSDLYRESKIKILYKLQTRLIRQADYFSSENEQTRELFYDTYGEWTKKIPHQIVKFGVDVIDSLKAIVASDVSILKQKWNIPADKIIIMLGYNKRVEQQHLEIINALEKLDKTVLDKAFFLIPMAYGMSLGVSGDEYIESVRHAIDKVTKDYVVLEEYLNVDEMAEFAKMTDVMVHVQTTDQLSSTMMAHMYDENIVIAGSWLPYGQIKEAGIKFWEIDKISELTEQLSDIIENMSAYKRECAGNRDRVYRFSSWEYCAKDWYAVYKTLMDKAEDR